MGTIYGPAGTRQGKNPWSLWRSEWERHQSSLHPQKTDIEGRKILHTNTSKAQSYVSNLFPRLSDSHV